MPEFGKFLDSIFAYGQKNKREILRFIVVGLVTAVVNITCFHVCLRNLNLDYKSSITLSYIVTLLVHFSLNRLYTFSVDKQRIERNAVKYALMLALNYVLTMVVMWLVVETVHLSPYFGVFASVVATAGSSFFIMKYFVFRSEVLP